jgi:hypothetical protein
MLAAVPPDRVADILAALGPPAACVGRVTSATGITMRVR